MILKDRNRIDRIQLVFFGAVLFCLIVFVLALPRISIPLSIAYVFSLAINPFINIISRLGFSRSSSIFIVFLCLLFLIVMPTIQFFPYLISEAENVQQYIPKTEQYVIYQYEQLVHYVHVHTGHQLSDTYFLNALEYLKGVITQIVVSSPNYFATLLEWMFLIPFFSFFILRDGHHLKKLLLSFTPNNIFERFYYVTHMFNKQLGNYIFAKFVEATIVGLIITIGLLIIDVQFAFIFGLVAGLTNVVPYVGPFIGAVPAIVFCLAEYGMTGTTGGVVALYVAANIIDIAFVFPILVSKVVNLHPVVVAISVIVGSHYLGVTGMVISIPLVAAIKLVFTEIYNEVFGSRHR